MGRTAPTEGLEAIVVARSSDIGGFEVRRALPSAQRRMVGPFVFLDQMGPAVLGAGEGLDVLPHPHIGLATVTYLFGGEILHRDSLGSVQPIRPGEVNWMTAGRGIVHSERTPPASRAVEGNLFGLQMWVALPREQEEGAPDFAHHPAGELPLLEEPGLQLRLIAGELHRRRSPVRTASALFCADLRLAPGARYVVPAEYEERAAYLAQGSLEVDGAGWEQGRLLVLRPGHRIGCTAGERGARLLLIGGEPLEGPRYVWWNFVASARERIEQAKEDWRNDRFPAVPGEEGRIPLPPPKRPQVNYP